MKYLTNSGTFEYDTIVLDLNWTLTVYGELDPLVPWLILQLKEVWYHIILLTGDQRWNASIFESLGIEIEIAWSAQAKKDFVKKLDSKGIVAIGNARIDIGMFEVSDLRIATLQHEWIHAQIILHVDIMVPTIVAALQLLLDTDVFAATMKI